MGDVPKEDCRATASSAGEGSLLCLGDIANMLPEPDFDSVLVGWSEACLDDASSAGDGPHVCLGEKADVSLPEKLPWDIDVEGALDVGDKPCCCLTPSDEMAVLSLSDGERAWPREDLAPLTYKWRRLSSVCVSLWLRVCRTTPANAIAV